MVPLLIIISHYIPLKNTILAMVPIHQPALKHCLFNAAPLGACVVWCLQHRCQRGAGRLKLGPLKTHLQKCELM
jgi:hypothetical protein